MTKGHKGSSRIESVGSNSRIVVLLAICLGIVIAASALVAGCGPEASQAPSKAVQTMLQDRFKAMSAGDTQAVATYYATNAVVDNYADQNNSIQGATAIADYFASVFRDFHMQWIADGDAIQYDRYVIQRVSNPQLNGPGTGAAVHILDIDANGQIAHEWIVGWAKP